MLVTTVFMLKYPDGTLHVPSSQKTPTIYWTLGAAQSARKQLGIEAEIIQLELREIG
jgi:hypothetical protein